MQAEALHDADYCRIFEKAAPGAGWDRPELHRMHRQLRPPVVIDQDVLHERGAVGSLYELGRTLDDCRATFCTPTGAKQNVSSQHHDLDRFCDRRSLILFVL